MPHSHDIQLSTAPGYNSTVVTVVIVTVGIVMVAKVCVSLTSRCVIYEVMVTG